MPVRPVRITLRALVAGGAVLAAMLSVVSVVRGELAPTPAEWARDAASLSAGHGQAWERRRDARHAAASYRIAQRHRELAESFERQSATWEEATYHGPFTSLLLRGQQVTPW